MGDLWRAVGRVAAPTAVLDLDAFEANGTEMLRRAHGKPIRVASKSIRVRGLIERVLQRDGHSGVLAYSAAEALWLARHGVEDIVIAYPTVDAEVMKAVAADPVLTGRVTFMADLPEHLQMLDAAARDMPLRVCLDIDSSLRLGPVAVGAHRSTLHTAQEAGRAAERAASMRGVRVVGLMFYEAQVAGVPDTSPVVRLMKRRSLAELATRRSLVVAAVSRHAELELVNGGGTGSLHSTTRDSAITELAAGSGFFTPRLFDGYDDTDLRPAAYFVSPVVRKPAADIAVTFSGGYIASGPPGKSRVPVPVHPAGLSLMGQEGAGEVQTPLRGKAARDLDVGDPVWFRHAKAGEMCERFNEILLVRGGRVEDRLPTYRGEGENFG
ncbi:alanine racemase [Leekyejoonella antrihumi]|uniref:Amino acid deaminase/aldolase n=1 Tax=Leekyejoonella antrihumi TaxID=1660198 RepID=A0A563E467_9MICO|nr:alanine racemase [Leekyejoonella antrihumi]TWP37318.1 amino acid deaminase/aldolase [Leekyejoonella antrihumi]